MPQLAATARDIGELFRDPALTVACVLLMVVSIGWVVITRIIARRLKRAVLLGQIKGRYREAVVAPKDIWKFPPPESGP